MSDEYDSGTSDPMLDQSPPGTPWPDSNKTKNSDDGPPPLVNEDKEKGTEP